MTAAGIARITIDGEDMPIGPESVIVDPIQQLQSIDTTGDSVLFSQWIGVGHADREERLQFTMPFGGQETDEETRPLRRVRALAGFRRLTLWKPETATYTAEAGQTIFYLPRRRRHAPLALGRYEARLPFRAWINGVAQVVATESGPSVGAPGAGSINVAAAAHTSGDARDYAEFRTTARAAGDLIEIEYVPEFLVYPSQPRVDYPYTTREIHSLTLVER